MTPVRPARRSRVQHISTEAQGRRETGVTKKTKKKGEREGGRGVRREPSRVHFAKGREGRKYLVVECSTTEEKRNTHTNKFNKKKEEREKKNREGGREKTVH